MARPGARLAPDPDLKERIADLLGVRVSSFQQVTGGFTPAARWTFRDSRRSYFAKVGTTDWTCAQLQHEIAVYQGVSGDFMPVYIASENHGPAPILILDDLSGAHWPPPWRDREIEAVLGQIAKERARRAAPAATAARGRLGLGRARPRPATSRLVGSSD